MPYVVQLEGRPLMGAKGSAVWTGLQADPSPQSPKIQDAVFPAGGSSPTFAGLTGS